MIKYVTIIFFHRPNWYLQTYYLEVNRVVTCTSKFSSSSCCQYLLFSVIPWPSLHLSLDLHLLLYIATLLMFLPNLVGLLSLLTKDFVVKLPTWGSIQHLIPFYEAPNINFLWFPPYCLPLSNFLVASSFEQLLLHLKISSFYHVLNWAFSHVCCWAIHCLLFTICYWYYIELCFILSISMLIWGQRNQYPLIFYYIFLW